MPLAGADCKGCAICSVVVVILVPDALPQRLKPPSIEKDTARLKSCPSERLPTAKNLLRYRGRDRLCSLLLFLPVADGGTDGVLVQHGTMDLYRRKRKLLHDVHVLDGEGFIHSLAFDPLGGQRGRGDRGAAAEGLELGFFNDIRVAVDLDL